jgi:hypothetical protein
VAPEMPSTIHRVALIPVEERPDGSLKASLGPQWKTLWYELSADE